MRYQIGDIVEFEGYPLSQVVGTDLYELRSLDGRVKNWVSYTLEAQDKSLRWWLSDESAGLYCWLPTTPDKVKGTLDLSESGLCILKIEGDSTVSSPYSSVAFFRDGTEFYSLEAFEGAGEVFSMMGHLYKI